MCDEDLPSADHLRERHSLVSSPFLDRLRGVCEDNEVVVGALVVDLGLRSVSTHVA